MQLLQQANREGATICMVTHDPRFVKHAGREILYSTAKSLLKAN